jgi:urease subunit alpha
MMHRSPDRVPLNVMLFGKGSTVGEEALREVALCGAGGYKVHEDWGATPPSTLR